jgi:hypothetical protein
MAAMSSRLETSLTRTMDSFTRVLRERGQLKDGGK